MPSWNDVLKEIQAAGSTHDLIRRKYLTEMGKHSSLGPIDPQIYGMPAHGVVEEFERAAKELQQNPTRVALWQPIIAKYHPTLIGECEKAIRWSVSMVKSWLVDGMFS